MTHVPSVASCRFCTAVSSSISTARCCASEIVGLNEGGRVQPVGVRDGANVQSDGAADGKRVGEGVGMGVRWLGHGDGTAVGFDVGDGVGVGVGVWVGERVPLQNALRPSNMPFVSQWCLRARVSYR